MDFELHFVLKLGSVRIAQKLVAEIGQQAVVQASAQPELAMDATGLARTAVSDYFTSRRGGSFGGG